MQSNSHRAYGKLSPFLHRYLALAKTIGQALLTTSVSRAEDFPQYPAGLVTTGFSFSEAAGTGSVEVGIVPVNYADLWTMKWLATEGGIPMWMPVLEENVRMMVAAQTESGQFMCSLHRSTQVCLSLLEHPAVTDGVCDLQEIRW